jgi:hypothetical protein
MVHDSLRKHRIAGQAPSSRARASIERPGELG